MKGELTTGAGCDHVFVPAAEVGPGLEPALVLLHGRGADENALLSVAESLADHGRSNVLSLRGFFPSGNGRAFVEDGADREATAASVANSGERVAALLTWAAGRYELDPQQTVVLGVDDGATVATNLLFFHPETVGGAVLVRPRLPVPPKPLPALPGYPVLLVIGQHEVPDIEADAEALQDALFGCGCDVRHHRVHLEHDFDAHLIHVARGWYHRVVKVESAEAAEDALRANGQ